MDDNETTVTETGAAAELAMRFAERAQPRLGVLTDGIADEVVRLAKLGHRARQCEAGFLHDDCRLDVPLRTPQQRVGLWLWPEYTGVSTPWQRHAVSPIDHRPPSGTASHIECQT